MEKEYQIQRWIPVTTTDFIWETCCYPNSEKWKDDLKRLKSFYPNDRFRVIVIEHKETILFEDSVSHNSIVK